MPYFQNFRKVDIYYEVIAEKKTLFPLIFVHGYGNSLNMFQHQIELLKPYFQLILIDAEGHGKTGNTPSKITDALLTNSIRDLEDLIEHLEINTNFGFICHSLMGTSIAIEFTKKYPKMVEFLIILNGGNLLLDNTIRNIFWNLLPQFTRMNFQEISQNDSSTLIERTLPFIKKALQMNEKQVEEILDLECDIRENLNEMFLTKMNLDDITCNTLIIGAELDNYAPLYLSKELNKQLKKSQLFIVGMTGHFGLSQRYHEYNKIIMNFLIENDYQNQNRSENYERKSIEPTKINGF